MFTTIAKWGAAAVLAVTAFAGSAVDAMAQTNGCVIYSDSRFRGDRFAFRSNQEILRFNRLNDRVSSIQIAEQCQLRVFSGFNGGGDEAVFTDSVSFVGNEWNNRISGAACECGRARQAESRRGQCVIYEDRDYGGDFFRFESGQEALSFGRFWNDRVSSVRVSEGCELRAFIDRDGRGAQRVFDQDDNSLGSAWNDRISGAVCECGDVRRGREATAQRRQARGEPPSLRRRGAGCVAYDYRRFEYSDRRDQGHWRHFTSDGEIKRLGNRLRDRISSIRVAPGCRAILDVGAPYKLLFDDDIAELHRLGFEDKSIGLGCECR